MPLTLPALAAYLDDLLQPARYSDYAPNGLQVEGRSEVRRVVTAVSANQATIDAAVEAGADVLITHHGFFWRNEERVVIGHRARRLGALLANGISLFGYHLPLDAHASLGNNVGLLAALDATPTTSFGGSPPIGWIGDLDQPTPVEEVVANIAAVTDRSPLAFLTGPAEVRSIAALSGAGAGYFEEAVAAGVDLFVTGEPSEMAQGLATELSVTFVAAGHHATERFGPEALGVHLEEGLGLEVSFIDVPNPV